jgi:hypothetical protein
MRIIEIAPLENGAHRNQTIGNGFYFSKLPAGWAIIPADMETPNFPFGEVEAEEINGKMIVTKWTPGEMPEPVPVPEPEPTQLDRIEAQVAYTAMMTDTLLEE